MSFWRNFILCCMIQKFKTKSYSSHSNCIKCNSVFVKQYTWNNISSIISYMIFIYRSPFHCCHFQIYNFPIILPYITIYGSNRVCIILIINYASQKCFTVFFRKSTFIAIPVMHFSIQSSIIPADRNKTAGICPESISKCIFASHLIISSYPFHRDAARCSCNHCFRICCVKFIDFISFCRKHCLCSIVIIRCLNRYIREFRRCIFVRYIFCQILFTFLSINNNFICVILSICFVFCCVLCVPCLIFLTVRSIFQTFHTLIQIHSLFCFRKSCC